MGSKTPARRRLNRICAVLGIKPHRDPVPKNMDAGPPTHLLWEAQRRRCYLCDGRMRADNPHHPGAPPRDFRTRDHVVPKRSSGGNRANVLLACEECNADKSERLPFACELIYLAAINAQLEAAA